ncbi:MAG TPA: maleylpyruvate isomerase family mycothiol-dependent enzyme [Nocardioidaceae bacterium]|nr:maleylpyruvate isomerase family mycothiol-dependent enzyme [Nocardioidaceae bacterium]
MTIDRSLLPTVDPFTLMDRESARIEDFLRTLVEAGDDDPGWQAPTRCSEWDARALFGHLRHLEDYNAACVGGTVKALIGAIESAHDFDDFNAFGIAKYATTPVAELFEDWRSMNAAYRSAMRERGDGVVDTSVGEYPSLFQAYYLATEYATHGDDFGLATTYDGRDAWRAAFVRFACTEQEKPLTFEVQEGSTLVTLDGATYEVIDRDLGEAGVVRLRADHPLPQAVRNALRCAA